jgi:hypothetical protein
MSVAQVGWVVICIYRDSHVRWKIKGGALSGVCGFCLCAPACVRRRVSEPCHSLVVGRPAQPLVLQPYSRSFALGALAFLQQGPGQLVLSLAVLHG